MNDLGLIDARDREGAVGNRAPSRSLASQLLSRNALSDLPTPQPLIDDTLDLGAVALLIGYWSTCKSFIALDWAASIATGRDWQRRYVEQRRVLYVAAEGAYGLGQRLTAWEVQKRTIITDDALTVLPTRINLGNRADVFELCGIVIDGKYGVVVVDTLAKSMVGMDENAAKDMGIAVDALYHLRDATGGGTVIAVHHTGKDKVTSRGSSSLEAGVDTVYKTEGGSNRLKVYRDKRKNGPLHDELQLTLVPVDTTESASLVSAAPADITGRAEELMSVYVSAFSATGATKADLRAAADMAPATFHRALNTLVNMGIFVNEATDVRPFYTTPKQ